MSSVTASVGRRLLFLHGQYIPPRPYCEERLVVDMMQALHDDGWECVFVKSPRQCPHAPPDLLYQLFPEMEAEKDHPEWLNSQKNDDGTKTYHGLPESLNFLRDYLQSQPRFDVIAGHSNGALMASVLSLKLQAEGDAFLPKDKLWSGLLLCNGPASYETETQLSSEVLPKAGGPVVSNLPSIHVWGGPNDMTWEGQQDLQRIHHPNEATIVQHTAGHFFPTGEAAKPINDQIVAALNAIVPPPES